MTKRHAFALQMIFADLHTQNDAEPRNNTEATQTHRANKFVFSFINHIQRNTIRGHLKSTSAFNEMQHATHQGIGRHDDFLNDFTDAHIRGH